jgi:trehalose 6-phosphate synthase/phosphatase
LVGKKNLEVRPSAVNKGEIVKRILYLNPDAEFVFCAGDDKTDEDMFRALLFPTNPTDPDAPLRMDPPIAITHTDKSAQPVQLALRTDGIFSTAVGHSSKRTLAAWHVTSPGEVVDSMLSLVNGGEESKL